MHPEVRAAFDSALPAARQGMLALRSMIFRRAAELPQVGRVDEVLRWGQPAYVTPDTGAGCSLRIGPLKHGGFGLFVHCRTDLIETFRAGPGAAMRTEGTRAVLFESAEDVAEEPLSFLIGRALTYHLP
jgi:hypothetical protein